jgi:hypothetical protein
MWIPAKATSKLQGLKRSLEKDKNKRGERAK